MKKIVILTSLIILVAVLSFSPVLADDASPSAKTQDLLDRVTTKVAELSNELRRTYSGKIKAIGTTTITITTANAERSISTNDVTNFYRIRAGHTSTIDFSDLKVGDDVVGVGTVDPQHYEMTARQIIAKIQRYNLVGTITDSSQSTVTIQELSGQAATVDLTNAVSLEKTDVKGKIQSAKVADFQKGDMVFVMAYLDNPNTTTFSTLKALAYFQ